jgi:cytochrome P450
MASLIWGGSAQEVFPDPWKFRWDRGQPVLFTFGGGPHLCPGRTPAHVLVEHSLPAFVQRAVRWRLVGGHPCRWQPASAMRELVDFPVEVTRPAA